MDGWGGEKQRLGQSEWEKEGKVRVCLMVFLFCSHVMVLAVALQL